jgi:hypothetical protein
MPTQSTKFFSSNHGDVTYKPKNTLVTVWEHVAETLMLCRIGASTLGREYIDSLITYSNSGIGVGMY